MSWKHLTDNRANEQALDDVHDMLDYGDTTNVGRITLDACTEPDARSHTVVRSGELIIGIEVIVDGCTRDIDPRIAIWEP